MGFCFIARSPPRRRSRHPGRCRSWRVTELGHFTVPLSLAFRLLLYSSVLLRSLPQLFAFLLHLVGNKYRYRFNGKEHRLLTRDSKYKRSLIDATLMLKGTGSETTKKTRNNHLQRGGECFVRLAYRHTDVKQGLGCAREKAPLARLGPHQRAYRSGREHAKGEGISMRRFKKNRGGGLSRVQRHDRRSSMQESYCRPSKPPKAW